MKKCKACKEEAMHEDDEFCLFCGCGFINNPLTAQKDPSATSPAAMAGSTPLCDECQKEIKEDAVICPDCCAAIHEDCSEQEDGEMCCPICAEDRRAQ